MIQVGVEYRVRTEEAQAKVRGLGGAFGEAGKKAKELEGKVRELDRASNLFSSGLSRLSVVLAGAFGLHQGKRALIDFNSEMEQAKITAAGLLQLNLGGSWNQNMGEATEVVKRLQQEAKTSIGTTKDMVQMFSFLAQPLSSAGASLEDYVQMTKSSVVASRAMGIEAQVAARDVDQAMRGQYHAIDQFTSKLLGPMGFMGEAGRRRFNKMAQDQRMATLRLALNQPAIAEMARVQGASFAGVMSTFQDNIQIALGKVGLPLFKEITREVRRWNEWIEKNHDTLERFGKDLGQGVVRAFQTLRDVSEVILRHWKEIAAVWAGFKVGGLAGNLGSGLAGLGNSALLGGSTMGIAASRLAMFAGGLGLAITATAALVAAWTAASAYLTHKSQKEKEYRASGADLVSVSKMMRGGQSAAALSKLESMGLLDPSSGALNVKKVQDILGGWYSDSATNRGIASALGVRGNSPFLSARGNANVSNKDVASAFAREFFNMKQPIGDYGPPLPKDYAEPRDFARGHGDTFIDKVEVKMDFEDVDPERVFTRFVDDLNSQLGRRTDSAAAHPEME
jgi:hypothetical protein